MISPCDELSVKISPFSARQRETVKEKIGAFVHVGMREAPECLVPGHIPVRLREVLKAEKRRFYIGSTFAEICPHAFSTYNTAGRREAIVSTCSPLPNRFMSKVSTQYAANLVGIFVAYLGRSPIKLFSPVSLISAVRLVGNCHFDNSLC